MAKISELVKTYKLLSDPNAPDWNVKFVGAIVVAAVLLAGAGLALYAATHDSAAPTAPAAAVSEDAPPGDLTSCDATEVAQEMSRLGATSLPKGHTLPSGCVIR